MTLAFKTSAVSVAFGTASFFMDDGGRTVRVDVSEELLARIGGHQCMSKQERVRRLERHKRRFAQIAAAKYDEGHYEAEVKVFVVRLGIDDMVDHAHG